MIKLMDILTEGKLTEGSLKQAMQQWKYIEKGLKPKQKKLWIDLENILVEKKERKDNGK